MSRHIEYNKNEEFSFTRLKYKQFVILYDIFHAHFHLTNPSKMRS